ncbi:sulfur carrier protein [Deinobacterium chartae]|uniref:Sulfur carrier protein n=1 Tax=Deinobacterium chartae TaxID=521158 RepID=A0A841I2Z6_9DEIO|nr:sulfur carrier protein ThiS [Deinobacterium chartae]MBB6099653.1 sulfur carrier protein [Deinobacterium chartae]
MLINGQPHPHREDLTLLTLLEELGIDPRKVAVMVNDDLYPAGRAEDRPLAEHDVLEVVRMMQGG